MIAADQRAVMKETIRGAIVSALASADADIDKVLAQAGWLEMLADEPDAAIDIVISVLGATNATATALDDVVVAALGEKPRTDLAVVLPRFAAWDPPGRIEADEWQVRGLATRRVDNAREMLVLGGTSMEP